MFTSRQQSIALDALLSFRTHPEQVNVVQARTGLGRSQAVRLVEEMKVAQGTRAGELRTFFAVASSIGEEMARYTYTAQAFLSAAVLVFGFGLFFSNQAFLGFVCFGLAVVNVSYVVFGLRRLHRVQASEGVHVDDAAGATPSEASRPVSVTKDASSEGESVQRAA